MWLFYDWPDAPAEMKLKIVGFLNPISTNKRCITAKNKKKKVANLIL